MEQRLHTEKWDAFVKRTLSHVRYLPARINLEEELLDHLQDSYEDMLSEGLSEEEAVENAVSFMGDADEIGKNLNKVHNPLIGWLYFFAKIILAAVIIFSIIPIINLGILTVSTVVDSFTDYRDRGEIIFSVPIDKNIKLDNHTLRFDELVYYNNGEYEIRYKDKITLFDRTVKWSFGLGFDDVSDGEGNIAHFRGGESRGGWNSRCTQRFSFEDETPPQQIVINYDSGSYKPRSFSITVNLPEVTG